MIVDTALKNRARAVIMGLPRGAAQRSGFSRALETVLAERPCRIIVDTPGPDPVSGGDVESSQADKLAGGRSGR